MKISTRNANVRDIQCFKTIHPPVSYISFLSLCPSIVSKSGPMTVSVYLRICTEARAGCWEPPLRAFTTLLAWDRASHSEPKVLRLLLVMLFWYLFLFFFFPFLGSPNRFLGSMYLCPSIHPLDGWAGITGPCSWAGPFRGYWGFKHRSPCSWL